jgi:electron-transferring-flavoprotein dehydrogenase
VLAGCEAGFLNGAKIKGTHTAMKTGMLAAESAFAALAADAPDTLVDFEERVRNSWVYDELYRVRNFGPAQHKLGTFLGAAFTWFDQNLAGGRLPFTWHNRVPDHAALKRAADCPRIEYPRPDGVVSFDRLSSVYLSSTNHEEDQPCHLRLADPDIPVQHNLPLYAEPAQRYCPAGVYEIVAEAGGERLQINAQNCVHCKTCDIKDPAQNIDWTVPEGRRRPQLHRHVALGATGCFSRLRPPAPAPRHRRCTGRQCRGRHRAGAAHAPASPARACRWRRSGGRARRPRHGR